MNWERENRAVDNGAADKAPRMYVDDILGLVLALLQRSSVRAFA